MSADVILYILSPDEENHWHARPASWSPPLCWQLHQGVLQGKPVVGLPRMMAKGILSLFRFSPVKRSKHLGRRIWHVFIAPVEPKGMPAGDWHWVENMGVACRFFGWADNRKWSLSWVDHSFIPICTVVETVRKLCFAVQFRETGVHWDGGSQSIREPPEMSLTNRPWAEDQRL